MALSFTPGQQRFVGALAKETGLGPKVVGSWVYAEQNGSAAQGYQQRGYHNWLNIANTDSGPASGSQSPVWRNPLTAAKATAEWLKGTGQIAREYGKPAPGIMAILNAAGKDPQAQIAAIANSPWASSHYNGGSTLRSLFGQLGGQQFPAETSGGTVQGSTAAVAAPAAGSSSDVVSQLLAAVKSQAPAPLELGSPAKPAASAGPILPQGSHAPTPLTPVQPQDASLQKLLQAAQAAQPTAEAAPAASTTAVPSASTEGVAADEDRHGLVNFGGKQVAAWIAPILSYARSQGWKGDVSSGYRSKAEQERIYNSGVRPAAVPGTSNHEGQAFPRGAVDVTEAAQLSKILEHSPYAKALVYAGSKDPVHFSHPHNGSY